MWTIQSAESRISYCGLVNGLCAVCVYVQVSVCLLNLVSLFLWDRIPLVGTRMAPQVSVPVNWFHHGTPSILNYPNSLQESCAFMCSLKYSQFISITQSCLTLREPMDPMDYHQLPELAQIHVHRVGDAIQPSHPLLSPSPPVFNLSQPWGFLPVSRFFTSGG